MRLLLDTHVLLWWLDDSPRLPSMIREMIADPEKTVFLSTAVLWEIRIKQRLGKLVLPSHFDVVLDSLAFHWLPISRTHADRTAALPEHHRDPFDRMLVAQAQSEDLILVTGEAHLAMYGRNVLTFRPN
jgi:PIN domain nuclease of toxin-antitoxin system